MPMLDVFQDNPEFSMIELTHAINAREYVPSRLGDSALFTSRGIRSSRFALERKDHTVNLIDFDERGAPVKRVSRDVRNIRDFEIPRLARGAELYADEIRMVRAFGEEDQLQAYQDLLDERVMKATTAIEATIEFGRMGALRGQLIEPTGAVYYDYFNAFGVTPPTPQTFALSGPALGIRKELAAVQRRMEDVLGDVGFSYVHCYCGPNVIDLLVENEEIKDAYDRWNDGQQKRERYARRTFGFAEVIFEEYRGKLPDENGVVRNFIGDDEMIFVPMGAQTPLFETVYAPADFFDTVNMMGLPRYVRPNEKESDDRMQVWEVQSHPLSICTRPEVIQLGVAT